MKQHLCAPPAIPASLLVVVVVDVDVGAGRPPECHSAVSGVPCRSCVPECCVGGAAGWRAVCRSAVPRPPCHTCHTAVPCRARRAGGFQVRPSRGPAAPEVGPRGPNRAPSCLQTSLHPLSEPSFNFPPNPLSEPSFNFPPSTPLHSSECFPTPLHPVIIYVGHNTVRLRLLKEKCLHHFGVSCKTNGTTAPPRPRL